jgi:hypothetical protein
MDWSPLEEKPACGAPTPAASRGSKIIAFH